MFESTVCQRVLHGIDERGTYLVVQEAEIDLHRANMEVEWVHMGGSAEVGDSDASKFRPLSAAYRLYLWANSRTIRNKSMPP